MKVMTGLSQAKSSEPTHKYAPKGKGRGEEGWKAAVDVIEKVKQIKQFKMGFRTNRITAMQRKAFLCKDVFLTTLFLPQHSSNTVTATSVDILSKLLIR